MSVRGHRSRQIRKRIGGGARSPHRAIGKALAPSDTGGRGQSGCLRAPPPCHWARSIASRNRFYLLKAQRARDVFRKEARNRLARPEPADRGLRRVGASGWMLLNAVPVSQAATWTDPDNIVERCRQIERSSAAWRHREETTNTLCTNMPGKNLAALRECSALLGNRGELLSRFAGRGLVPRVWAVDAQIAIEGIRGRKVCLIGPAWSAARRHWRHSPRASRALR